MGVGSTTALAAGHGPVGKVDVLKVSADRATWTLTGWAVDANAPATTVAVDFYLDGVFLSEASANGARTDLPAAYGPAHGFTSSFAAPTATGNHYACVYSINPTGGTNPLLGCRRVSVPTPVQTTTTTTTTTTTPTVTSHLAGLVNPLVKSDAGATWTLSGWVVDYSAPDTAVAYHVYVDNTFIVAGSATGAGHTYSTSFAAPTTAGTHYACVYAINPTGGTNPLLGCRRIVV
ncbi:MAG: hypothetical protein ACXWBO_01590 [Ilumatobacteraceae bacterium]